MKPENNEQIKKRVSAETQLVTCIINELINHGFTITLPNNPRITESQDGEEIVKEILSFVLSIVYVQSDKINGVLHVALGNNGYDSIAGYTNDLEPFLVNTFALSNQLKIKISDG